MLRWYSLRVQLEGGKLAHDPLEAGFARERLSSLRQLRRTAFVPPCDAIELRGVLLTCGVDS